MTDQKPRFSYQTYFLMTVSVIAAALSTIVLIVHLGVPLARLFVIAAVPVFGTFFYLTGLSLVLLIAVGVIKLLDLDEEVRQMNEKLFVFGSVVSTSIFLFASLFASEMPDGQYSLYFPQWFLLLFLIPPSLMVLNLIFGAARTTWRVNQAQVSSK